MTVPRRPLLAAAWTTLAAASACAPAPVPPPPATIELSITGGSNQNPDPAGHTTSVAVRILQLGSIAKFGRADFFALAEREKATLGDEEVASEELLIAPGDKQTIKRALKAGTQFLGIIVAFRDIDRSRWRVSTPVASSGPSKFTLTIDGQKAELAPG